MKKNYPLPSVVVKKNTTTLTTKDNDSFYSFPKNVVQGCCIKEARQQRQRFFLTKKMLSFVVVRNSTTTKTTKDNYSLFSSLKMLSKVVLRCRKNSTLRQRESPQCVIKKSYINLVA